ncbi:hypothetical protein BD324DRAFT_650973 [Kockovaella imperatae]|uniref:Uncharacterized protein n=1 Tax=Kockovaella imperatae TaxID=4999 RepID=A0A1Y1UIQ4_9TREE|nr:hypothetical protein BD324DRAFT_650973 [Kockovaella imperatae]ORX37376.1 hypothetical protein BD324DRAFT_650973 [Kockovaella imperatae]
MPTSSDPYDFDDDLFADTAALDQLEASALQASQAAPRSRVTQPYHHTVTKPKPSILSSNVTFSGRKAPQPINTEPRAGNSGFGWEYGGKRSIEGNVERHVENVNKRQAYWSNNQPGGYTTSNVIQEEESYRPDIVVGENGYELGEDEIVDSHTTRNFGVAPPASQSGRSEAAAARRAAIQQASQSIKQESNVAGPSHARSTSIDPGKLAPGRQFPGQARNFARSVSAGHHPSTTAQTFPSGGGSRLSPIPSEGSGSQTSSQGSLARKTAIQLEEEKRRAQALEQEIADLKKQLERRQRAEPARQKQAAQEGMEVDSEDVAAKMDELKNQLWKAQGEAQTMRRAQKEEQLRAIAEADRLKAKIADMESKFREREREVARQVENVKTQAVFANHAALSSAIKARASSQRPAPTPIRNGSPQGKSDEAAFLKSIKGKGRAPPPPPPRFDAFKDGFATPTMARIKRPRMESVTPAPVSPQKRASQSTPRQLTHSPTRRGETGEDANGLEIHENGFDLEGVMDIDVSPEDDAPDEPTWTDLPDKRGEFLYFLFHHTSLPCVRRSSDPEGLLRPDLYRLLSYEPKQDVDPQHSVPALCATLLAACGDSDLDYEHLLGIFAVFGTGLANVFRKAIGARVATHEAVNALCAILSMLGRATALFDEFGGILTSHQPSIIETLCGLCDDLGSVELRVSMNSSAEDEVAEEKRKTTHWQSVLQTEIGCLTQGICASPKSGSPWNNDELVNISMYLTSKEQPVDRIMYGIHVILTASTFSENFRALIEDSRRFSGFSPVLDRCSRLLIDPLPDASERQLYDMYTSLIRALSMMSIADQDAIILIAERTLVVPALIMLLTRETPKLWGVWAEEVDVQRTLDIILPTLYLLHHLVIPVQYPRALSGPSAKSSTLISASQKQASGDYTSDQMDPLPDPEKSPQGINLVERLRSVSQMREFQAIGHQFISVFGALSYATPMFDYEQVKGFDLPSVQYISQDILEMVVEGPEADAVYEMYADEEEESNEGERDKVSSREEAEAVDMEVYDAMSVGDETEVRGDGSAWQPLIID